MTTLAVKIERLIFLIYIYIYIYIYEILEFLDFLYLLQTLQYFLTYLDYLENISILFCNAFYIHQEKINLYTLINF